MGNIRPTICSVLISTSLAGCLSFTAAQTAETVPKGRMSGFLGATYAKLDQDDDKKSDTVSIGANLSKMSGLVGGFRYGVASNVDIGLTAGTYALPTADVKYQYLDQEKTDAAVGLGVAYLTQNQKTRNIRFVNGSMSSTDSESFSRYIELHLPLYFSQRIDEKSAIYAVPRFVYTSAHGDDYTDTTAWGGSIGVITGKRFGYFGEVSYFSRKLSDSTQTAMTFAGGIALNALK